MLHIKRKFRYILLTDRRSTDITDRRTDNQQSVEVASYLKLVAYLGWTFVETLKATAGLDRESAPPSPHSTTCSTQSLLQNWWCWWKGRGGWKGREVEGERGAGRGDTEGKWEKGRGVFTLSLLPLRPPVPPPSVHPPPPSSLLLTQPRAGSHWLIPMIFENSSFE